MQRYVNIPPEVDILRTVKEKLRISFFALFFAVQMI